MMKMANVEIIKPREAVKESGGLAGATDRTVQPIKPRHAPQIRNRSETGGL
jgi:hypothetical protein